MRRWLYFCFNFFADDRDMVRWAKATVDELVAGDDDHTGYMQHFASECNRGW